MWTRRELKAKGKAAFKANYWRCVLVALILTLISGGVGAASGWHSSHSIQQQQEQQQEQIVTGEINGHEIVLSDGDDLNALLNELEQDPEVTGAVSFLLPIILGVLAVVFVVSFLLSILLLNPLIVGCKRFFAENSRSPAVLDEISYGFRSGYGRVVKTMLLTDVFLFLWTLLFIIPGIIKAYSYRMVPFILAEDPDISGREAINRSREMMDGNKWRSFVLDLSFILWILLSCITLGIVGVFYVFPYMSATEAELYHVLNNSEKPLLDDGYRFGF